MHMEKSGIKMLLHTALYMLQQSASKCDWYSEEANLIHVHIHTNIKIHATNWRMLFKQSSCLRTIKKIFKTHFQLSTSQCYSLLIGGISKSVFSLSLTFQTFVEMSISRTPFHCILRHSSCASTIHWRRQGNTVEKLQIMQLVDLELRFAKLPFIRSRINFHTQHSLQASAPALWY